MRLVAHLVAEAVKDRDVGEVPAEVTAVDSGIRAGTGGRLHLELTRPVTGVAVRVVVGRGVDQGDFCPGDVFLDAVFDRGAVPGGLPVHPDVPVDRSKRVGQTGRDSHTVHPVVPGGSLRTCDTSDFSSAGVQVDGVDQHLVDAVSAVGREVDPVVVTPRGPKWPGGDCIGRSVGFGEVDNPGTGRVVIPVDTQLSLVRDAHHVRALAVT